MSKTRCNLFYCVVRVIMCFNSYSFGWQLLLGQLLLCFNDYHVLKITDILMSIILSIIRNAWIFGIHDSQSNICVLSH